MGWVNPIIWISLVNFRPPFALVFYANANLPGYKEQ
jgi:hypothetical protein